MSAEEFYETHWAGSELRERDKFLVIVLLKSYQVFLKREELRIQNAAIAKEHGIDMNNLPELPEGVEPK